MMGLMPLPFLSLWVQMMTIGTTRLVIVNYAGGLGGKINYFAMLINLASPLVDGRSFIAWTMLGMKMFLASQARHSGAMKICNTSVKGQQHATFMDSLKWNIRFTNRVWRMDAGHRD